MILQALTSYYESLLKQGRISQPGWDNACKISFGLELDEKGELVDILPYHRTVKSGKKEKVINNQLFKSPARVKRSSGIAANFICDTSTYLLGADAKGRPERTLNCFEASRKLHQKLLSNCTSPAAEAILSFFDQWDPGKAAENKILMPYWREITGGGNLIFCYDLEPVSSDSEIAEAWQEYYRSGDENSRKGQCLVTGNMGSIARTHPSIKGVNGAQSSGASLVSFNAPAYDSYGHTQGGNAPVSEYAAFAYTTALNMLLADREHCKVIGDTTVVCWAEHGEEAYQDFGMDALYGDVQGISDADLSAALSKLAKGEVCEWNAVTLNPDEHFYFLGLSPNASRLSVRFFLQDSFGSFMKNLNQHYQDIAIIRPAYDNRKNLSLWQLLNETVNQKSKNKEASHQMTGNVLQAILSGTPYPATLLNGAELRIRAERDITRGRAAILKAYYSRRPNPGCPKEVLQMELNEQSTNIAYTLGRMFSVYEQIQKKANPNITTTIKDKYFNSASATPALIFPVLGNLAQKHLRVLRRDNGGAAVYLEKKLGEFSLILGESFPARLNLPEQGSFQLGYYFENQAQYKKKED